ncbi:MAG: ATP-binding protein [Candidatus Riflebacteria bacterium]|nr:ATP-binding protein [Candidatus Riflebacteria bacterium]
MTLKPWRDVITPHEDVLEGTYQEAEFAADLSKVAAGRASPEYQDPVKFFERTFITEGTRLLLNSLMRRLSGRGGDPVIQLKTAFGGGKTHSMLAVYHIASTALPASKLAGIPSIIDQAGISELPRARVVVIDGNNLGVSQPRTRDGVLVNTLWGELAWQLGGKSAFDMLTNADRDGTSPGKEILVALFTKYSPCVILMDETVAYVRQFEAKKQYAGGTFESNISFLQALTEAVTQSPKTSLLASLPESNLEIGGSRGQEALDHIEKIFGRVEAIWKPVATQEGFEIVRRRLFGSIIDQKGRDAVCRAYADLYTRESGKFPTQSAESTYYDRLVASYPVHPEIFERLYEDWASLEKFQRTRGVLRLMAMVIHRLWSDGCKDLLIMPGSLPLYDSQISNELIRYLPQGWEPVIERDVDGKRAGPTDLDDRNPLLGAIQAARRVARTVFLGSAPSVSAQRVRGIGPTNIRLGTVQPEQSIGRYDDALGHLSNQLHYMYAGNERYWYDTRPNLRREMEDRALRLKVVEELVPEIQTRLKVLIKCSLFTGIHVMTPHGDIPDDHGLRLVVLPPTEHHARRNDKSPAAQWSLNCLKQRGSQPRLYQNRLLFLVPDEEAVKSLWLLARRAMAWQSIGDDKAILNLDQFQTKDAEKNRVEASAALDASLRETYRWLLAPTQEAKSRGGVTDIGWDEQALPSSSEKIGKVIETVLHDNELMISRWSPFHLKGQLDLWFWREGVSDVSVVDVWKNFCSYPYLPRLLNQQVLLDTISDGAASKDFFGFAAGRDGNRYLGLHFGERGNAYGDKNALIVKREAAQAQQEQESVTSTTGADVNGGSGSVEAKITVEKKSGGPGIPGVSQDPATFGGKTVPGNGTTPVVPQKTYHRFHASISLDPLTMPTQASKITEEVLKHLASQYGAKVQVTMEIEAESPTGFSDTTCRTVRENAKTLNFVNWDFEEE